MSGVLLRSTLRRPPPGTSLTQFVALGLRAPARAPWTAAGFSTHTRATSSLWNQVTPSRALPATKWHRYAPPAFSSRALTLTSTSQAAPWVVALRRASANPSSSAASYSSSSSNGDVKKAATNDKEDSKEVAPAQAQSLMDRTRALGRAIADGAAHYWAGTKLLGAQVRIASKYVAKLTRGERLARRERKLLTRTVADLFRVIPFAVFILVPLGELLLPFYLRLFPQMLPSTFESSFEKEERLKNQLKARIEFAHFLQDTAEEMARTVVAKRMGETKDDAEDFVKFIDSVRMGKNVTPESLDRYAKLFRDEFTLDRVNRPQLVAMAQLLGINQYGTNAWLRFQLRSRIQALKVDDRTIRAEGLENMSLEELRAANISRGMRAIGLKKAGLERQLSDWLELSLDRGFPTTLLILSRAFTLVGGIRTEEAIANTLSSMPEEVVEELQVEMGTESNEKKLEILQKEAEAVEDEVAEQAVFEASQAEERAALQAAADAGDKEAAEKLAASATAEVAETVKESQQTLAEEDAAAVASPDAKKGKGKGKGKTKSAKAKAKAKAKKAAKKAMERGINPVAGVLTGDQLEDLGKCVETLAGSSVIASERDRLDDLREEMSVLSSELGEDYDGPEHGARLGKRVASMLSKLQEEANAVEQEIGDRFVKLDADGDGKLTLDELQHALTMIKDAPPAHAVRSLAESMDADRDGAVAMEELSEVTTPHEDKMEKIHDAADKVDTDLKKKTLPAPEGAAAPADPADVAPPAPPASGSAAPPS